MHTSVEEARNIISIIKKYYEYPNQFNNAVFDDYPHLEKEWFYDRSREYLKKQGFYHLRDIEYIPPSYGKEGRYEKTILRQMLSGDGTIMVQFFQPVLKKGNYLYKIFAKLSGKLPDKTISCISEMNDSRYIISTNSKKKEKEIKGIKVRYIKGLLPADFTAKSHGRELEFQMKWNKEFTEIIKIRDAYDMTASIMRLNAIREIYKKHGFLVNKDDMKNLMKYSSDINDYICKEIDSIKQRTKKSPIYHLFSKLFGSYYR